MVEKTTISKMFAIRYNHIKLSEYTALTYNHTRKSLMEINHVPLISRNLISKTMLNKQNT